MPKKSESIKVVFRVRPLNSKEKNDGRKISTIAHEKSGVVEVRNPSPDHENDASKTFSFDSVFSEHSTQRQIYDTCAAPVVSSVLDGYNGTIFAYGQTGAGKTHTSTFFVCSLRLKWLCIKVVYIKSLTLTSSFLYSFSGRRERSSDIEGHYSVNI